MKNAPIQRTKNRLWIQLVNSYISRILAQESISTIWKVNAEWDLMFALWAYQNYKIIEPFEAFIQ